MGYKLRREVRDALPPGKLTAAERLLILEIADNANDDTRRAYPGREELARLTDLAELSVPAMLTRIAEKWIDVRVPIGKDSKGRPVYGRQGHRTVFEFPDDLTRSDDGQTLEPSRVDDHQTNVRPASNQTFDAQQQKVRRSSTPSPQIPSGISSSRSRTVALPRADAKQRQQPNPIQTILDHTDATEADAQGLVDHLTNDPDVKTVAGFVRKLAQDGDLQRRLDQWRATGNEQRKKKRDIYRSVLRLAVLDQPECRHGFRGGHLALDDGWMSCSYRNNPESKADQRDLRNEPAVLACYLKLLEDRGHDGEADRIRGLLTDEQLDTLIEAEGGA